MNESTAKPGRPRSETSRAAILEAAFRALVERGYPGMSIEAVASAAGAGKTTIYRWWPGKAELAVDAFFHETQAALAFPDTGSAREDFRLQVTELADLLRGPRGIALVEMLGGARSDRALAQALGERWLEPRRRWGFARMSQAVAAGECRPGIDVRAALGIIYGPLYTPLLFGQDAPSVDSVERHLELVLSAVFQ